MIFRARVSAVLAAGLLLSGALAEAQTASAQAACGFALGFRAIRDQIPDVVGNCLEDERFNPDNSNADQRTRGGLLVWRQEDNWTAFTDGYQTWVNGPYGLQVRLNGERFRWEKPA